MLAILYYFFFYARPTQAETQEALQEGAPRTQARRREVRTCAFPLSTRRREEEQKQREEEERLRQEELARLRRIEQERLEAEERARLAEEEVDYEIQKSIFNENLSNAKKVTYFIIWTA